MKKSRWGALSALLLTATLASSCYGPFNATQRVHEWNGGMGGKWANEGMFLVLYIVPVYGLATLGDALIFNSIEFWGGDNPIDAPGAQ